MLYFTGETRFASKIEESKLTNINKTFKHFESIHDSVNSAYEILTNSKKNICELGELMNSMWFEKKELSPLVSTKIIEEIYQKSKMSGAIGFKVLGAGGGGFCLIFAEPQYQQQIREKLAGFTEVPFEFEPEGSRIIGYNI